MPNLQLLRRNLQDLKAKRAENTTNKQRVEKIPKKSKSNFTQEST